MIDFFYKSTLSVISLQQTPGHDNISNRVARYQLNPEELFIKLGDLTGQGLSLARKGYQRWLTNTGRSTGDTSIQKFKLPLQ